MSAASRPGVDAERPSLLDAYRHLHSHPELSGEEAATADFVAGQLDRCGLSLIRGLGGHGFVGVLENGSGPTLLLRTDLDALPVTEATGAEFASRVTSRRPDGSEVGVMHACGHDIHMTCLIGAVRALSADRGAWRGTLIALGQPAEEMGTGAAAMLADGLLAHIPHPDAAFALHCSPSLPAGRVGVRPGPALANVDSVDVHVRGVGGHGAYPHTTRDPIVLAAQIVLALQTLVSRETSPLEAAVVTVGAIHGGAKHNVISDEVRLALTVRSYSEAVRRHLLAGIERITSHLARAAGVPEDRLPIVTLLPGSIPATVNDSELVARTSSAFRAAFGEAAVVEVPPVMGGEDFGMFGRTDPRIPIHLFWLGAARPDTVAAAQRDGQTLPSLHSPTFLPDAPAAIATGTQALVTAVIAEANRP